jgi:hypothetical protein
MAHYSTLREYQFSPDVDDVRGSMVYGRDNEKLGKIDDVVLAHPTGEIRYVVITTAEGKRLLPPNRIFGAGDDDFQTRLSQADLATLPSFDHRALQSDRDWENYEQNYHGAYRKLREKYKAEWEEDPVQHRKGSTHDITPEPDEMPAGTSSAGSITEDVAPHRLAGKFPDPASGPSKITMTPEPAARIETAAHSAVPLSPRWLEFEESVRRDIENIRRSCTTCGETGQRVA